jgi:hypothetical protein
MKKDFPVLFSTGLRFKQTNSYVFYVNKFRKEGVMKRILSILFLLFFYQALVFSGIRLNSPTGNERWTLGTNKSITWSYSGLRDDTPVKLTLLRDRRRLGTIGENIKVSDRSYSWQVGSYRKGKMDLMENASNLGSCYLIEIESGPYRFVNTICFKILKPEISSSGPREYTRPQPKPIPPPPQIVSFQINSGASKTADRNVTLNFTAQNASRYRASEVQNFPGARWQSIVSNPSFELSQGRGGKTVYLQVKNLHGTESQVKSDTIRYTPAQPPKEYIIPGGDAYKYAKQHGFKFTFTCHDLNSQCRIFPTKDATCYLGISTKGKLKELGAKCDFVLFGGKQLNPGWSFKSDYLVTRGCSNTMYSRKGHRIDRRPSPGNRNIKYKIHGWVDPTSNPLHACVMYLQTLTLVGPAGMHWHDAFR